MKKVVYNTRPGGFGLSLQALQALRLAGFPLAETDRDRAGYTLDAFSLEMGGGLYGHKSLALLLQAATNKVCAFPSQDMALRSHPILVAVVEQMKGSASGPYADLAIRTLPDHTPYRIVDAGDGSEAVDIPGETDFVQGHVIQGAGKTALVQDTLALMHRRAAEQEGALDLEAAAAQSTGASA